jgi:hypothetical protein
MFCFVVDYTSLIHPTSFIRQFLDGSVGFVRRFGGHGRHPQEFIGGVLFERLAYLACVGDPRNAAWPYGE